VVRAGGSLYILEHRPESLLYLLAMIGPRARVLRAGPDGSVETVGVAGGWGKKLGAAAVLALVLWGLARVWRRGRVGPTDTF
jgi:hypothetical protein